MSATTITAEVVTDLPTEHAAPIGEIAAINRYHRRANEAADEARAKAQEASHFALLAGTLLEDLKASTPHGEWGKLFEAAPRRLGSNSNQTPKWLEFGQETARKYIELARRIRQERSLSGKAQKKIAAIASSDEIDAESREFLNRLTEGQSLRQLYLGLDIITAPEKPAKTKPGSITSEAAPKDTAQLRLEDARESLQHIKDAWEQFIRAGQLDDLIKRDLEDLKEWFAAEVRDRISARLK
jgi:hypothetical protein